MMRAIRVAVGAVALLLACAGAGAAQLTWSVTGGTFADGGSVAGTFTLDTTFNQIFSWSLTVAGGNTGTFSARSYTPANSASSLPTLTGGPQPSVVFAATDQANRVLRLTPAVALDGSSSPVALATGFGNGNVECFNCSPFRNITAGSLTLTAAAPDVVITSATPDPTMVGTSTLLTVSVTGVGALGVPTGSVTVYDNSSNPLCTLTLPATSCSFTPSAPAAQTLYAQYSGDANYESAFSGFFRMTISAAPAAPPTPPTPVPTLGPLALALLALLLMALAGGRFRRH
jgi:hypothetical protein